MSSPLDLTVRLRRDARVEIAADRLLIALPQGDYQFKPNDPSVMDGWGDLMKSLWGGVPASSLEEGSIGPSRARLIEQLYASSLVVLASSNQSCALSAHSRLKAAFVSCAASIPQPSVFDYLSGDNVDPRVIQGYAIEYYQTTRSAYGSIFPALPGSPAPFANSLLRLIREEYGHDKLMESGVAAFGVSKDTIEQLIPMPFTAALTRRLELAARYNRRLFAALIWVFERDSPLDERMSDLLEIHGAPKEFVEVKRQHDRLNTDGGHAEIGDELFAYLGDITLADEEKVGLDLWIFANLSAKRSHTLLKYYSDGETPLHRTPSALRQYSDRLYNGSAAREFAELSRSEATINTQKFVLSAIPSLLSMIHSYAGEEIRDQVGENLVELADEPLISIREVPAPVEVPVAAVALCDYMYSLAPRPAIGLEIASLALQCLSVIPYGDAAMNQSFKRALATIRCNLGSDEKVSVDSIQLGELLKELCAELRSGEVLGSMPYSSQLV